MGKIWYIKSRIEQQPSYATTFTEATVVTESFGHCPSKSKAKKEGEVGGVHRSPEKI